MDAMAFGMGCCCLQVTFQCRNIREARHLYDQLSVLSPILVLLPPVLLQLPLPPLPSLHSFQLALSAATPFFKGKIADTDVRWSVISQSVDDRTPAEKGLEVHLSHKDFRNVSNMNIAGLACRRKADP